MKKSFKVMVCLVILLAFLFTSVGLTTVAVSSIKLIDNSIKLQVGQSYTLIVSITPTNATNKKITYLSGNSKVATVDKNGKIVAKTVGKTVVTVTSNSNKKAVAKCNVVISKVQAEKINVYIGSLTQAPGSVIGPENKQNVWIKNKFGLEPTVRFTKDNAVQELTLMRATNSLPDVFNIDFNTDLAFDLIKDNKLMVLDEYIKKYANLKKLPEEILAFGNINGRTLGLPTNFSPDIKKPQQEVNDWFLMRKDIPEMTGLKKPETLNEFLKVLRAIRDKGLKGENGQPMYPIGFSDPQAMLLFADRIFGGNSRTGNSLNLDDEGRIVPSWGTTGRYEGLKLLNLLWREKLMDPETFSQKINVKESKIAAGRYAFLYGSYGDAWAFIAPWQEKTDKDEVKKFFDKSELVAVPVIKAENAQSHALSSYSPWPTAQTVINSGLSESVADKMMKFFDWKLTEEGMYTVYYEGWPGETWKYNSDGKPYTTYRWTTYSEMMAGGKDWSYWDYHSWFVGLNNYQYLSKFLESGAQYKRPNEYWWTWLYGIEKQLYAKPEYLTLNDPIKSLKRGKIEADNSQKIEDIFNNQWANCVNAASQNAFDDEYKKMISQLLASDWKPIVKEKQEIWNNFSNANPAIKKLKGYATVKAIPEVLNELKK